MDNVLFSPITIGKRTAQNRFMIQSLECCDADPYGNPSPNTYQRYERFFDGDPGIIALEAITVTYDSRSKINQLSIMPRNQKALEKFVLHLKDCNPKPLFIFQLTHAGELSNMEFSRRVTVKPLHAYGGELLSEDEVDIIRDEFVLAAKICHDAGADGIDFKLCHGYLGSQILRPYNDRKWKYGGSFENRSRFVFDVIEKIVKEVNDPNFIISSKISMWEGFPGGQGTAGPESPLMDMTENIALVKGLEERGLQLAIQSAGGNANLYLSQPSRGNRESAYLHQYFTKVLKDNLKPETVVAGSGYTIYRDGRNDLGAYESEKLSLKYRAAQNINNGLVDIIALGRQALADPLVPKKMMEGEENKIRWCTTCDNCGELLLKQQNTACVTYNKECARKFLELRKMGIVR